jgi:hypothetical protein
MAHAPTKEELLADLARLNEVSGRNEGLVTAIGQGVKSDADLLAEMDRNVVEQSSIVDKFLGLCDDEDAKTAFRSIVAEIESVTRKLEGAPDEEEAAFKERLLLLIRNWITALEEIVTGVIAKAQS